MNTDSLSLRSIKIQGKYYGQIRIMFGVEVGITAPFKMHSNFIQKIMTLTSLSVLLISATAKIPTILNSLREEVRQAHQEYFGSIWNVSKRLPYFDVYGHLDYVVRYGPTKNQNYSYPKHADIIDRILHAIVESGKGIVVHTPPAPFRS